MACRVEMIAFHVHGHEADIDAFFEDLEKTVEEKATEAEKLWPSLEFMAPDDLEILDDGEDDYGGD